MNKENSLFHKKELFNAYIVRHQLDIVYLIFFICYIHYSCICTLMNGTHVHMNNDINLQKLRVKNI